MLELVLQGFAFQVPTRVELPPLPAQPRVGVSCVYRAAFPTGHREGFLQHKLCLSPLEFLLGNFSITTFFSISTFSLPTPQAAGRSSLQLPQSLQP